MKTSILLSALLVFPFAGHAQHGDFEFGAVSASAFFMKKYSLDTTADAVVLKEFGRTVIDNDQDNMLVHFRHVRIKIFNERGLRKATFTIPLQTSGSDGKSEKVYDIRAATYNLDENGHVVTSALSQRNVFRENKNRYKDVVKFTLPNAKAGSVIEVQYTLSSPYLYNFRQWDFQSDIPKMYSEYWAKIPANLDYNVSLIGYYKLTENDRSVARDCLTTFNGGKADCTLLKLGMKNIPAFHEEKYMTAKSNFLSSVHFELSAIHRFNGSVEKVSKTWDNVDQELQTSKEFGVQIKKAVPFFRKKFDSLTTAGDPLSRAKKIYHLIQQLYKWDGYTGIYCENGIRKAFEQHQGNIGDINLALTAALRAADCDATPVLISTRDNGVPHDLFPATSDFNYVLVLLQAGGKSWLLDASQSDLPFGVFPMQCINGRGRAIYGRKPSAWVPVNAPVMEKEVDIARLKVNDSGLVSGTFTRSYSGYRALAKREEIRSFGSRDEYLAHLNAHSQIKILADSISNLDDPAQSLVETLKIMTTAGGDSGTSIIINPFLHRFATDNPFKSSERHYPIDFGAPEILQTVLSLDYPPGYKVTSFPKTTLLALPDNGGKYILGKTGFGNKIIVTTVTRLDKAVYPPDAYSALKEFYNRIIQSQRADLILSRN